MPVDQRRVVQRNALKEVAALPPSDAGLALGERIADLARVEKDGGIGADGERALREPDGVADRVRREADNRVRMQSCQRRQALKLGDGRDAHRDGDRQERRPVARMLPSVAVSCRQVAHLLLAQQQDVVAEADCQDGSLVGRRRPVEIEDRRLGPARKTDNQPAAC